MDAEAGGSTSDKTAHTLHISQGCSSRMLIKIPFNRQGMMVVHVCVLWLTVQPVITKQTVHAKSKRAKL